MSLPTEMFRCLKSMIPSNCIFFLLVLLYNRREVTDRTGPANLDPLQVSTVLEYDTQSLVNKWLAFENEYNRF